MGLKSDRIRRDDIKAHVTSMKDRPCADCGLSFPPWVMDFDHVRGQKEFALSTAYRKASSLRKASKEAEKCDVVCANCHRDRTQRLHRGLHLDPSLVVVPGSVKPASGQTWYEANKARTAALIKVRRLETAEFIRSLKDGKLCADCGVRYPYWCLEFDHLRDKSIGISYITTQKHWGRERILEEIAKCDLVCANCHRERTRGRLAEAC